MNIATFQKLTNQINEKRFKFNDIDYFDFYLFENYDFDDITFHENKTYYRNVFLFFETIKVIAIVTIENN